VHAEASANAVKDETAKEAFERRSEGM